MKKARRIVAFAGAAVLVVLYVLTLVFAVMQTENWQKWFEAAMFCSPGLPVLLYAMQLMYRVLNKSGAQDQKDKMPAKKQEAEIQPADIGKNEQNH